MRIFSLITAVIVTCVLALLVLNREELIAFASGTADQPEETLETAAVADPSDQSTEPKVSVIALRSESQVVDSAVVLRGQTEAARKVEVRAEISGLIVSEPLRKGIYVEAGQLLCEIEVGTRNAGLAEAEARRAEAQISFTAEERLTQGGFASETTLASARAQLQAAQAGVEVAQKELDRLKILAPFGGLLESDTAELGSLMQPGSSCATVIQLNPIKLVGFVPETEVNLIADNATAAARLATGQEVTGSMTFLSRSSDPLTRTFRVEIEVQNDNLEIRDGQTAEIIIASQGSAAHLLPQSALTLDNDGRLGVRMVDENDRAAFAPITLVRDTMNGAWLSGLPEQVKVIVSGQEFVTDGVALDVSYQEARK